MKTYTSKELSQPSNTATVEDLVRLLADSFTEDASHRWLFSNRSNPQSYMKALLSYFGVIVRYSILCGAIFWVITEDDSQLLDKDTTSTPPPPKREGQHTGTICTAAIVIPPEGQAKFDSLTVPARAGWWKLFYTCGITFNWRCLFTFLPGLDKLHHDMFPDPAIKYNNWHLFYLATDAKYRGRGLGRQLLLELQKSVRQYNQSGLERMKVTGQKFTPAPLYLEASSVANKRLYNSVGFEDRSTMVYGELDESENLRLDENNKVIGGRQFGMIWLS